MTKQELLTAIQDLPEVFELEYLFKRLLFIERIKESIRQSDNGETLTEVQVRCYLGRWLKQ
jgi:hypothetical protein